MPLHSIFPPGHTIQAERTASIFLCTRITSPFLFRFPLLPTTGFRKRGVARMVVGLNGAVG